MFEIFQSPDFWLIIKNKIDSLKAKLLGDTLLQTSQPNPYIMLCKSLM